MISSNLVFSISKCSNETRSKLSDDKKCHPPEKIDAFVKRIQVETWANFQIVDFSKHNVRPTIRIEKWVKTNLLDPLK